MKNKGTVSVRLERPGVKACGAYQAGEIYEVSAEEAERLVNLKGFKKVAGTAPAADANPPKNSEE